MFSVFNVSSKSKPALACKRRAGFAADERGATAVEFGMVALPFLMMLAGIIDVGSYYLALNSLDRGLDETARFVRTGEAQTGGYSFTTNNVTTADLTVAGFTKKVCQQAQAAGGSFDCTQFKVILNSASTWAGLANANQTCTQGTAPNVTLVAGSNGTDTLNSHVGGTSAMVIATVCYPWGMAKFLPFLNIGNLQDGSMLLQSSTAFQTEPY